MAQERKISTVLATTINNFEVELPVCDETTTVFVGLKKNTSEASDTDAEKVRLHKQCVNAVN